MVEQLESWPTYFRRRMFHQTRDLFERYIDIHVSFYTLGKRVISRISKPLGIFNGNTK